MALSKERKTECYFTSALPPSVPIRASAVAGKGAESKARQSCAAGGVADGRFTVGKAALPHAGRGGEASPCHFMADGGCTPRTTAGPADRFCEGCIGMIGTTGSTLGPH